MKLPLATIFLTLRFTPSANAQTCNGVTGAFSLREITGECNYDRLHREYASQVFDATGSICADGSDVTAEEDLDAKMKAWTNTGSGEEAAAVICKELYDNAETTAFTEAANKGSDLHFEQEFYNGRGPWQEEVETNYETDDQSVASSVLRGSTGDARAVEEFYQGRGSYSRVSWKTDGPGELTNFAPATCTMNAAMCCWPKDRQANDGNGNCAKPYDINCVDKDPADNTNLCFADLAKGNASTGLDSNDGFMAFPGDGNDGEGAIHCHGFAWANDDYDATSRYKSNNLFFVSMYDHMHQRGYVKNIPGMPMCGCLDQMPIVTQSDCTQVDVTENWQLDFDGTTITTKMIKVEIDFNACQGRGNENNDLWAYAARLYDEGGITAEQFGKVGRVLTNDHDCYHATEFAKQQKGLYTGYTHAADTWTKVAGRDVMKTEPLGREAFRKALFEQSLTAPSDPTASDFVIGEQPIIMRVCATCVDTHKKVFYRRKTPITDPNFDLLNNILFHRNDGNGQNKWGEDFSLHSTYHDAVTGNNEWECINDAFNYNAPFDGECSPTGAKIRDQYSIWNWHPGPRANVAYYVNKPDKTGAQDYTDNVDAIAAGMTDVDIGNVGLEGNTMEDNGVFHITGSGNDIWGYEDQFHFKSYPASGDIDVSVHISSFAGIVNQHAKAGIMLRSDISPDATYVFNILTGSDGIYNHHRRSKGKYASHTGRYETSPSQTSAWLRILKKGEKIEYYRGDGVPGEWILMSTDTVLFPDDQFRVGLAVCSHHNGYLSEATFDNFVMEEYNSPTSSPTISMAPTPWNPTVEIGNPQRAGSHAISTDGSIYYTKGSGTGIWGSSDSFFYQNEQRVMASGMSVQMYIKKFDNGSIHSRGGLMIRDSNDSNAANIFVGAAGSDSGVVFQSRATDGADTDHHNMIYVNNINSMWVKLDMNEEKVVTASYKVDEGDEWIVLGSKELVLLGSTVQVGRAVTAGSNYQYALESMESRGYTVS